MPRICLFACLILLAVPLYAANRKKYPLRVQVQEDSFRCPYCPSSPYMTIDTNTSAGFLAESKDMHVRSVAPPNFGSSASHSRLLFFGHGSGLLFFANKKYQSFRFSYRNCFDPLPVSSQPLIAAKWKHPNQQLDVLVPPYSPHKPVDFAAKYPSSCQLSITLQGPIHATQ